MIDSRVVGESRVRFLTECRGYAGLGEKTRWDQIKGQGSFFALEPKGDVCLKKQLTPGEVNGRLTNIEKKAQELRNRWAIVDGQLVVGSIATKELPARSGSSSGIKWVR